MPRQLGESETLTRLPHQPSGHAHPSRTKGCCFNLQTIWNPLVKEPQETTKMSSKVAYSPEEAGEDEGGEDRSIHYEAQNRNIWKINLQNRPTRLHCWQADRSEGKITGWSPQAPKRRLHCKHPPYKPHPPSRSRGLNRLQEQPPANLNRDFAVKIQN